jgi:type I restriction enzyme S subunit
MSEWAPDGWCSEKLERLCILQRGFDLPVQNRIPGTYPILGSNGIVGFHNKGKVPAPGVVTGRSGSIGQVWYLENDFWALNTSLYVKEFHGNHQKFVYYFLQYFDLSRFGTGTGVPTLNRNDVHRVKIHFPPCPEQRKIATILTSVDEVIDKTKSQIVTSPLPLGQPA